MRRHQASALASVNYEVELGRKRRGQARVEEAASVHGYTMRLS